MYSGWPSDLRAIFLLEQKDGNGRDGVPCFPKLNLSLAASGCVSGGVTLAGGTGINIGLRIHTHFFVFLQLVHIRGRHGIAESWELSTLFPFVGSLSTKPHSVAMARHPDKPSTSLEQYGVIWACLDEAFARLLPGPRAWSIFDRSWEGAAVGFSLMQRVHGG